MLPSRSSWRTWLSTALTSFMVDLEESIVAMVPLGFRRGGRGVLFDRVELAMGEDYRRDICRSCRLVARSCNRRRGVVVEGSTRPLIDIYVHNTTYLHTSQATARLIGTMLSNRIRGDKIRRPAWYIGPFVTCRLTRARAGG